MLLPAIDGLLDQGAHRFPQHIFFRHSANLAVHGRRANGFDDVVIQKGREEK
jgi:hypothetical protein